MHGALENIVKPIKHQSQHNSSAVIVCWNVLEAYWSKSVDPDQTAPIGAVWSGLHCLPLYLH